MKKLLVLFILGFFLTIVSGSLFAGEKASPEITEFAQSTLVGLGLDPIIVTAVKMENSKGKSLKQIKEIDEKWKSHAGIADYMQKMMDSECGKRLLEIQNSASYFDEIFVMDNQGANVAMTDKTSDYWQGDEPKFTESYKGGMGAVHIGDVEFDDSSQSYLVQVSVPVVDGGKVIGAMTIGVNVDNFN